MRSKESDESATSLIYFCISF